MRYAVDTTWNEAAKRSQLEEGLYHELKNDLIARDEPEWFVDFVSLLQKLNQKRHHLTASVPGYKAALTIQQHTHAYVHAHPTPLTVSKTPATATTASGIHAGPIDLSARKKKLTLEERACYLAEGRCLYYGSMGHVARNCPNAHCHPLRAIEGRLVPHNHDAAATATTTAKENTAHLN